MHGRFRHCRSPVELRPSLADRAMPLQNRVTPEGEIIATPHRGLMMGNRGGGFHSARPDAEAAPLGHQAMDRLRAGVQGPAPRSSCSPTATPSCSSSTRRRRSPPAIGPASNAAAPTPSGSPSCGARRMAAPSAARAPAMDDDAARRARGPRRRQAKSHFAALADIPSGAFVPLRARMAPRRAPISLSAISFWPGRRQATRHCVSPAARRRDRSADAAVHRCRTFSRISSHAASRRPQRCWAESRTRGSRAMTRSTLKRTLRRVYAC